MAKSRMIAPEPGAIGPQLGPQVKFCRSTADIVIYGGQAGGGKSFALLLEAARNVDHSAYRGVIFRRTYPEIVAGGGLWDTAGRIYPNYGGVGKEESRYVFPSGAQIKFSHLQHEDDKNKHYGAAYSFIAFDELITFTRSQFFFLLSRCRPPDGYDRPCYIRATTNPDADSWVLELIEWWIDADGYPIRERSGERRYFTVEDDKVVWVDEKWRGADGVMPISIDFISASIDDNPALIARDPNYKRNLYAQDRVTRERLLYGNWRISYTGGMFDPKWFKVIAPQEVPHGIRLCRYWDFAATEATDGNDPDWTAGALCGTHEGNLYIIDIQRFREAPGTTIEKVKAAAARDGRGVMISWEQEKGSAGRFNSSHMSGMLAGYEYRPDPVSGDKVERAKPLAAAAEFGRVFIVSGEWNKAFLAEAGSFPMKKRDQIDAVDGAYKMLCVLKKVWPEWSADDILGPDSVIDLGNQAAMAKALHYGALVCSPDGSGVYVAAVYDPAANHLCVYASLGWPDVSAARVASDITQRSALRVAGMTKLVGNADMFTASGQRGVATLINTELARLRGVPVRVTRPLKYDESGAIVFMGQMFSDGRVAVLKGAEAAGVEAAGWCYEESGSKAERGSRYAEALCLIASELRERMAVIRAKPRTDYAPVKKPVEETGGWLSA